MTAYRNTRSVALHRQQLQFNDVWTRVIVPPLNPNGSFIYPPIPGELPGYTLRLEGCEKESFRTWQRTLSPTDQARVEAAIQLERIQ